MFLGCAKWPASGLCMINDYIRLVFPLSRRKGPQSYKLLYTTVYTLIVPDLAIGLSIVRPGVLSCKATKPSYLPLAALRASQQVVIQCGMRDAKPSHSQIILHHSKQGYAGLSNNKPLVGMGPLPLSPRRYLSRWFTLGFAKFASGLQPLYALAIWPADIDPKWPVGWNCTNSRSCMGSPAREAIALPSPPL